MLCSCQLALVLSALAQPACSLSLGVRVCVYVCAHSTKTSAKPLCAILSTLPLCSPFPQLDTEYRKKWDSLVIKLEVVDRDSNTGSEVVHWATQFPVSSGFLLCKGSVCVCICRVSLRCHSALSPCHVTINESFVLEVSVWF